MALALAIGVLAAALADEPRSVAVTVSAPWEASDPAVEVATLIWQDAGDTAVQRFWTAWAAAPAPVGPVSYHDLVRRALDASDTSGGSDSGDPMSLTLLQRALGASLAARSAAPAVEMWHQLSGLAAQVRR